MWFGVVFSMILLFIFLYLTADSYSGLAGGIFVPYSFSRNGNSQYANSASILSLILFIFFNVYSLHLVEIGKETWKYVISAIAGYVMFIATFFISLSALYTHFFFIPYLFVFIYLITYINNKIKKDKNNRSIYIVYIFFLIQVLLGILFWKLRMYAPQ